jgi:uncharacterized protein (TIGR03083 family)
MDHREYCGALATEVERFAALVSGADPATPVRTCPGWDLARLIGHVGSTHRWVTAIVTSGATEPPAFEPFRTAVPVDPAALPCWLSDGAAELVATLAATPPDRPVWARAAPPRVAFWPRRMLHEAAIHHADAVLALGRRVAVAPPVAEDGIDEYLTILPHLGGVTGVVPFLTAGRSIVLAATDTGTLWWVSTEDGRLSWRRADDRSGAAEVVCASAVDLYLYLWGRVPVPTAKLKLLAGGGRRRPPPASRRDQAG